MLLAMMSPTAVMAAILLSIISSSFASLLPPINNRFCSACIDPALYPTPRRNASTSDVFFGTTVLDPYRWMEDADSGETKAFVQQLSAQSADYVSRSESRAVLTTRMTEMWNYEKFIGTSKRGKYYYYGHNSGLQNQFVIYQQTSLGEQGKVFLDPNTLSNDGTVDLRSGTFTNDGTIYAYGLGANGSDPATIKFKTAEGADLEDVIPDTIFGSVAWLGDNSGVFYSKYTTKEGGVNNGTSDRQYHTLLFHKLGTSVAEDILIYRLDESNNGTGGLVSATVTKDGNLLVISIAQSPSTNKLYYYDLKKASYKIEGPIQITPLFEQDGLQFGYVDNDGDTMYLGTNMDAPMTKIIKISLEAGASSAVDVISENPKSTLRSALPLVGGRLLVQYLEDVKDVAYVYDKTTGRKLYQIPLDFDSISGSSAYKDTDEVFIYGQSFITPYVEYRLNFAGHSLEEMPPLEQLRRTSVNGLATERLQVEQVFYPSKDGTKVPMYIISNKKMRKNGNNPTVLYGYGGYGITETPYFSITHLLFVLHFGGVYATAGIRGGGEYGEKWHEAGMLLNKQNGFDDFIAAAEYLIHHGYTRTDKLAINGASNGGLLVGAVLDQRKDLFGAAIIDVGTLDMIRFPLFTAGRLWVPEYGDPNNETDFHNLIRYSPLHNVRMPLIGQWPATLLTTADHDDRVVPMHTLKFIATLYEKAKQHPLQRKPILARIEINAGHGFATPTNKQIAEAVDMYCFLQRTLQMTWRE